MSKSKLPCQPNISDSLTLATMISKLPVKKLVMVAKGWKSGNIGPTYHRGQKYITIFSNKLTELVKMQNL